jgi:hypothetical protein
MTALRTQAFVHGRTAQRRECCIEFGTCEDLVQKNMTSLRATSNHANLVTSPWCLAEHRKLHHSGLTAHWHPSFESSQRYGLKFHSSAIWHREIFLDYHKNGFTFTWPRIVTNFFLIKPTDALIFPHLFMSRNYMFRAVPLPIIRSFPLYLRHWYMSCKYDNIYQCRMYSGKLLMVGKELPETCRVSWQK